MYDRFETVVVRGKIDSCDHLFCHECTQVQQAGELLCPGCRTPFQSIARSIDERQVPCRAKSVSLADADDSLSSCSSASDSDEALPDFRTRVLNGKGKHRLADAAREEYARP